jgi:heterodisulfide reductase subunit C
MHTINLTNSVDRDFIREVEQESGQNVSLCYQCGNCTAGCPYTFAYDIPVSRIMRMVQSGQKDELLACKSIWLCATCESCTTRCPNNIDVAAIMETLRHMARRQGTIGEKRVKTFYDEFLDSVRRHGRVFEMGLMTRYIAKTGRFWTDLELGPKLAPRGKLSLRPHDVKGREQIAKIFKRFEEEQNR